ncbi:MAG: BMP family protein [Cytophagales bacterium]|nr:BMP family protein [Armatimonadota bacterium]
MTQNLRRPTAFFVPSLIVFAALAAGCAQQSGSAGDTAASPAASATASGTGGKTMALKVALITPGKISDKGWSQSAYEGQQRIKAELGAETSPPVESPALSDVASVFQNQAQEGNTLIFAHGSEFDAAAKTVAASVPQTTMVVMGGRAIAPNLMPIQFASGQATYLAGVVAGGMTRTNKIGLVGVQKIPIIVAAFSAFEQGVKSTNSEATVTTTYVGSEDIAKAKQQTQALLDSGVDVVMHNANEGGKGVADAVMAKDGAMFIGANSDQSDLATPKNLGSFILDVPSAMLAVAKEVQGGKRGGAPYMAGVKDKAVFFKYNTKFAGTISDSLRAKVTEVETALASGTLDPSK